MAVVRNIEVIALRIKQYIANVLWAFGTSNTGYNTVGDRLNEVTVCLGSIQVYDIESLNRRQHNTVNL